MADTDCGWCGRLAYMPAVSGLFNPRPHGGSGIYQAAFQCPNCKMLNLATEPVPGRDPSPQNRTQAVAETYKWGSRVSWLPRFGDKQEFEDVPPQIAAAASEATLCLSVEAYRAVGSLARAVVEATAKDKGAEGGSLYASIEALAAAGHVRLHTKEQAHEVRHFGNGYGSRRLHRRRLGG